MKKNFANKIFPSKFLGVLCGIGALLASAPARATLGEPQSSVETTRAHMGGVVKEVVKNDTYSVQELSQGPVGVREYVSIRSGLCSR